MPIIVNTLEVDDIEVHKVIFNEKELKKVYCDDILVFERVPVYPITEVIDEIVLDPERLGGYNIPQVTTTGVAWGGPSLKRRPINLTIGSDPSCGIISVKGGYCKGGTNYVPSKNTERVFDSTGLIRWKEANSTEVHNIMPTSVYVGNFNRGSWSEYESSKWVTVGGEASTTPLSELVSSTELATEKAKQWSPVIKLSYRYADPQIILMYGDNTGYAYAEERLEKLFTNGSSGFYMQTFLDGDLTTCETIFDEDPYLLHSGYVSIKGDSVEFTDCTEVVSSTYSKLWIYYKPLGTTVAKKIELTKIMVSPEYKPRSKYYTYPEANVSTAESIDNFAPADVLILPAITFFGQPIIGKGTYGS